jgi:hypothetical protein
MEKLRQFVSEHLNDDLSRLVLNGRKWPEIDMNLAIACIESRHKLKNKVQDWYDNPDLIFPLKLSAEQCSSSATGHYKSELAEHIAQMTLASGNNAAVWRLADLTGGLGVDSWYFSKRADKVLYNEMQTPLCDAARNNFKALKSENILISNHAVAESKTRDCAEFGKSPSELLSDFRPDIIYMDPARRGEGGKKVFLIEECTPDVLTLKDELFTISRNILIKLSPMADITMVCERLGHTCREVHVVAAGGECKELLVWMDREWNDEYSICAVELPSTYPDKEAAEFRFTQEEEKKACAPAASEIEGFLFEPGKSITKAGAFNLVSQKMGIKKIGKSTHYYVTDDAVKAESLKSYGKVFRISECLPLDKRSIRQIGKDHPKAEVTAKNIPLTSDALRKKIGCASGGEAHIFGLKSNIHGALLLVCNRI